MKFGTTNKHTTGHFTLRDSFDIPEGTRVVYGAPDCDGQPFPHWTLPEHVARDLSGDSHDAAHRFVTVHADHVTPDPETATYGLFVRYRPYRCDCCGHVHDIQTNHTGRVASHCPNCSWRYGRDSTGRGYRADTEKQRPHVYAGGPVTPDEVNPHAKRTA